MSLALFRASPALRVGIRARAFSASASSSSSNSTPSGTTAIAPTPTVVSSSLRRNPNALALNNRPNSVISHVKVWGELAKFHLSAMVVLSGGAGFMLAGPPFDVEKLVWVSLGTSLAAASAATFNQLYEKTTDAQMLRTRHRPLPAGRVSSHAAAAFGVSTGVTSVALLTSMCNPLTGALGLLNIGLYAGVYTPLKRITTWNTWVGAIVGAVPPVMGYTAATGTMCAAPPLLLGITLLLWQFPHFFALSWILRKDYARGGHLMVPCVDPTGVRTGRILVGYQLASTALPFAAYAIGASTFMFPVESAFINAYMLWACRKFQKESSDENARRVFRASLWQLPALMGAFVLHSTEDRRVVLDQDMNEYAPDVYLHWRGSDASTHMDRVRATLKEWCLHEGWIASTPSESTIVAKSISPDQHPGFCPVTKLEAKTEAVVDSMSDKSTARLST